MNGRVKYTKEELEQFIHDFIEEEGRLPKQRDFLHNPTRPSFKQYIDTFGSWSSCLIQLGYVSDNKKQVNKNTHICRNCGVEFKAYGKRAYCSHECRYSDKTKYERSTKSLSSSGYRRLAFRNYEWKCQICGYNEHLNYTKGTNMNMYPVCLDVHHLDGDRTNNTVDNLSILCPTCHALVHRGVIINVRRSKRFSKLLFDYAPVFGGEQLSLLRDMKEKLG